MGKAKAKTSKKKEINITGHDLEIKSGLREEIISEVFAKLGEIAPVRSSVALKSSFDMLEKRYAVDGLGSVGGGLCFIELGALNGLEDYCVLLSRLEKAVEWKTIDGEQIRLIWSFGFPHEVDKQFVIDFIAYLSQLFLDPGVWEMLLGKSPMTENVTALEKFISADIKADVAIGKAEYKKALEHCNNALKFAKKSSRIKTKTARINDMVAQSERVLRSYRDGK